MATEVFSSYLTWSEEDEQRLLVCTDVGCAIVPPGSPYPLADAVHPASHRSVATGRVVNEYQLVYITEGRGSFVSGGETIPVEPGCVLAVFPGVPHAYRPDTETGWTERWVGFRGPAADTLRANGFHAPERPFYRIGVHAAVLTTFNAIFETVRRQDPFYQFRAGALILLLISDIRGMVRTAEIGGGRRDMAERAKHIMNDRIHADVRVDEIARRLGVSTPALSDAFRDCTGLTPYGYFLHLKINRAKEMLSEDGASVKEVAYGLGFSDQYYFSRLFKRKTGVAPRDYMKRPVAGG